VSFTFTLASKWGCDNLNEKMFIMRRVGRCEIGPNDESNVIKAYNKMYVGYKMWVDWGIGGLKRKWK